MPATGESVRHCTLAVFALTIAAMAAHFAAYLVYAVKAVRYPYELDYGEGIVWQQAMLIPGARMYGDINQFPFIVFHYPPLYHLLLHAAALLKLDVLAAGRGVSLASSLGIGTVAAALAFRVVREGTGRLASASGAAIAGLGVFCFWPVVAWSPMLRVDMLAILLSFLGIWCAARSLARPSLIYVAMVLFVLAIYTKQTSLAAPLATVPVLLVAEPRRMLKASCLGLLLAVAALVVLMWQTDGGFLRHVILYNLNRYSLGSAGRVLLAEAPQLVFLVLAAAGAVAAWRRLASRHAWVSPAAFRDTLAASEATRLLSILTLYLGLSTCALLTLGKSGGNMNYMIEWMCLLSVLTGILAAGMLDRALRPVEGAYPGGGAAAFLASVALLAQVLVLPASRDLGAADPARMQQLGTLLERIRAAKAPVLSDDMVLLMKAGKEVPWEPAIFAELASIGRWDERRIVTMINAHAFAFVVTQGQHGMPFYDSRYTPAVDQAIGASYPRVETYAGHTVHLPPLRSEQLAQP